MNKTYNFENSKIFNIFPEFKEIKKINSSIFKIINKTGDSMIIKCLSNSTEYILEMKKNKFSTLLEENNFLWINYYESEVNKILLNKFSTFEVLNEDYFTF